MLVLRTTKSELSDLDISIAEFDRKFIPRLLMPVINISGDLTLEEFTKKDIIEYGLTGFPKNSQKKSLERMKAVCISTAVFLHMMSR